MGTRMREGMAAILASCATRETKDIGQSNDHQQGEGDVEVFGQHSRAGHDAHHHEGAQPDCTG